MHAAVAQKPQQVQGALLFHTAVHHPAQGRILEKVPVLNGLGDSGQILIHNTPGAHVQMPHLGIAHLPRRQAHVQPAGIAPDMGPFFQKLLVVGHLGRPYRISRLVRPYAKPVQYQ